MYTVRLHLADSDYELQLKSWQMHHPKRFSRNGWNLLATPSVRSIGPIYRDPYLYNSTIPVLILSRAIRASIVSLLPLLQMLWHHFHRIQNLNDDHQDQAMRSQGNHIHRICSQTSWYAMCAQVLPRRGRFQTIWSRR